MGAPPPRRVPFWLRSLTGTQRLFSFATLLGVAAAALWYVLLETRSPAPVVGAVPWWAVLIGCTAGSFLVVRVRVLRETVNCSLGEAAVAFGLLSVDARLLLGCYAGSVLVAHVSRRGPHPVKDYSNLMLDGLYIAVAALVLRAIGTAGDPLSGRNLLAVVVAMASAGCIAGPIAINAGVFAYQGLLSARDLVRSVLVQILATTVATSLGLTAFAFFTVQPILLAAVAPPLVLLALAQLTTAASQRRADRLEFLYATSEALHAPKPVEQRAGDLLRGIADMFSVARAELVLVPEARDAALRFTVSGDAHTATAGRSDLTYAEQEALNALRSLPLMSGPQGRAAKSALNLLLAERGASFGTVVSLQGHDRPQGMLLMLDPVAGDLELKRRDEELLLAVAQHVTAALENGQLAGALRQMSRERDERTRRAFYDPLTQIANRSLFDETVTRSLARLGTARRPVALLCIDLDGFAAVNEQLGPEAGDQVLSAIAARLRTQIRRFDMVARLGGDEFGILLDGMRRRDDVQIVAGRIVETLREPIQLANGTAAVSGSVGVAVVDDPSEAPPVEELLRRADMAMYLAKRQGKNRYLVFDTGARAPVIAAPSGSPAQAVSV